MRHTSLIYYVLGVNDSSLLPREFLISGDFRSSYLVAATFLTALTRICEPTTGLASVVLADALNQNPLVRLVKLLSLQIARLVTQ